MFYLILDSNVSNVPSVRHLLKLNTSTNVMQSKR